MPTPGINRGRVTLVPYTAAYVTDEHVGWLNDPDVVRYSELRHRQHTIESEHRYLNDFSANPDRHIWAILCAGKAGSVGATIGNINAYIDRPNNTANMGILIGHKASWGKGYGLESWEAVMNWLFREGIRKVEAGCMASNAAMAHLALSAGMLLEATVHDHFYLNGEPEDLFLFGRYA